MATLCRTCSRLRRCRIIGEPPGTDELAVSSDETPRVCKEWRAIPEEQWTVREDAHQISGMDSLKGIRLLGITDVEEDVDVDEPERPDLRALAGPMIACKAREDQLRYVTDEKGEFILDTHGQKIQRNSFWLRDYATDPNGPVKAKKEVVWFWSRKQLIDAILQAEKDAGIVVYADQAKKAGKEKEMARTINLRRPSSEAEAANSRAVKPATGKPPVEEEAPAPVSRIPTKAMGRGKAAPEPEVTVNLDPVMTRIGALEEKVDSLLSKFEELGNWLDAANSKQTDEVQELLTSTANAVIDAVEAAGDKNLLGTTILHDVYVQTTTGDDSQNLAVKGLTVLDLAEQKDPGN